MAIDEAQLQWLRQDHARVYGKPFSHFFCPILLEDSLGPRGLMDGHILPDAVVNASRKKVIQRADVDNYFGSKLETDLIQHVNAPLYTFPEFKKRAEIHAVSPDETKWPAQVFAGKSNPPFPKFEIPLPDETSDVLAKVFVKEQLPDPLPKMDFDFTIVSNKSLIVGALLKAAYLSMFRLIGYEYVKSCAGNSVRCKLAAFFKDGADVTTAPTYFHEFRNCYKIFKDDLFENGENTLTAGWLLFHVAPKEVPGDLFGVSCVFKMNELFYAVMIPLCNAPEHLNYLPAFLRYRQQVFYPDTPQTMYLGRHTGTAIEVYPRPIHFK
jgi:hypothetical protein